MMTASPKVKNETREKILRMIKRNPYITIKKISEEIGITERNIKEHITALKTANLIKRIGTPRAGYWEVR